MTINGTENPMALANRRRTTAEMYAYIRQTKDPFFAWQQFTKVQNRLFNEHSQSPLTAEQRAAFRQLSYYPYNPAFWVTGYLDYGVGHLEPDIDLGDEGILHLSRVAAVHFELLDQAGQLRLFWIKGYGGGFFLPFKDLTNPTETYGGGRYLYDTIKGADLGAQENEIVLDFNFAYNPSCAYDARWACPLAPKENSLKLAVTAGEKRFTL